MNVFCCALVDDEIRVFSNRCKLYPVDDFVPRHQNIHWCLSRTIVILCLCLFATSLLVDLSVRRKRSLGVQFTANKSEYFQQS